VRETDWKDTNAQPFCMLEHCPLAPISLHIVYERTYIGSFVQPIH